MCFSQHIPAHDLNVTNWDDLFMQLPFIALHEFFEAKMERPNNVHCSLWILFTFLSFFSFIIQVTYHCRKNRLIFVSAHACTDTDTDTSLMEIPLTSNIQLLKVVRLYEYKIQTNYLNLNMGTHTISHPVNFCSDNISSWFFSSQLMGLNLHHMTTNEWNNSKRYY